KRVVDYPGGRGFTDVWWRSPHEAFSALYGRQPLGLAASEARPVSIQIPPEALLFSRYKQALAAGDVQYDGQGTLARRLVVFLLYRRCELTPFPGHPGSSLGCSGLIDEKIAIDKRSHRPVAVYQSGDAPGEPYRIAKVELLPRDEANLAKPAPRPE